MPGVQDVEAAARGDDAAPARPHPGDDVVDRLRGGAGRRPRIVEDSSRGSSRDSSRIVVQGGHAPGVEPGGDVEHGLADRLGDDPAARQGQGDGAREAVTGTAGVARSWRAGRV